MLEGGVAQGGGAALLLQGQQPFQQDFFIDGLAIPGAQLRSRLGLKSTMVRFEVLAPQLAALPASLPALPPLMPRAAEPAISPDQVPVQLPPPSLLAIGRGFGHGVGMSQWGAHGMANRGQSYEQILHHYYRGTELRPYVSP